MSALWRDRLALALGLAACTQMLAAVMGWTALRGLAAAWGFAPNPKVFSDVAGLETFASEFSVATPAGPVVLGPERYQDLKGPYQRRNVYGAALSYAPRLPEAQWQAVYCYGLREGGPLRTELGLPERGALRIMIKTKTAGRSDQWLLDPPCAP